MKLYIVIPADYDSSDEVMVFCANSKEEAFDIYAEKEGQSSEIREFVRDRGCNMSFSERFWCTEDGRYMFQSRLDDECKVVPRMDIQIKYKFDHNKINQFLDDTYHQNVRDFFKHDPELADAYLSYMKEEIQELPERIYKYVAKYDEDWRHVDIKEYEITDIGVIHEVVS